MTITLKPQKLIVPCCKTIEFVIMDEIVYIEGLQNYTKLQLVDGSDHISTKNIGYYRERLSDSNFFPCHKSFLINVDRIIRYHKQGTVEMVDGTSIPIARRRKEEFLQIMLDKCD